MTTRIRELTDFNNYKRNTHFNEAMTRQQYIDIFLRLLGWDTNPMKNLYNDRNCC